ncbi:MAG: O-antigen ligase family protein [Caldilineaceae bacterium]|nr:O-antigen ligase family protein [Caldilineaceae bacterium]
MQPAEPMLPPLSWRSALGWWSVGIAAVILFGVTPLWGGSPWLGGALGMVLLTAPLWISKPHLVLLATIIVMLLPDGMIDPDLSSTLSLLLLLASLALWLLQAAFRRRVLVWTAPVLTMVFFYLWALVSLLWATDLIVARHELVQYFLVILVAFLLVNQIDSLARLDRFMAMLAWSGWILIGAALWTLAKGGFVAGERFQVLMLNENTLSTLLLLALPGILWPAVHKPSHRWGWLLLSLLYVGCAIGFTALSGSRGGLIAFIALFVIFGFTRTTKRWARWGSSVLLLLLAFAPILFTTVGERFTAPTVGDDFGGRDLLWQAGLLLIAEQPLTGAGIGNGPYLMPHYINILADEDHLWGRQQYPAHNPFIEVGTDLGLPGMVLYGTILVTAAWRLLLAWTAAKREQQQAIYAYCELVTCISIAVLLTWGKSGGMDSHLTIFLLVSMWIIPGRLSQYSIKRLINERVTL